MAQEPSLSEITSITVDAERGTGTPAVVFDTKSVVDTLNKAAQYKAASDWKKYETFQAGLADIYKNLSDTQSLETLEEDKPMLQKEAADILGQISKDPRALFGAKQGEIMGRLGQLRAKAVQSKQHKIFVDANGKFISTNPELNTDENKAKLDAFKKAKLEDRQTFTLDVPPVVDAAALFKGLEKAEEYEKATPTEDGQFIRSEKGTITKFDPYLQKAKAAWKLTADKQGRPIRKAFERMYNMLPDATRQAYEKNGGIDKFYEDMAINYFGGAQDRIEVKEELKPNTNYLEKEKLAQRAANDRGQLALGWARLNWDKEKERLDALQKSQPTKAEKERVEFLETFTNKAIDEAKKSGKVTYVSGTNVPQYELPLSNATLQAFGYNETILDPKTEKTTAIKVMPNRAVYSDDGMFEFKFYKRDDNGEIIKERGMPVIDETKTKRTTREEFKAVIGGELLGKKEASAELQQPVSVTQTTTTTTAVPGWAEPQ